MDDWAVSVCDRGCRSRARAALAGGVRRASFAACGECGDDWATRACWYGAPGRCRGFPAETRKSKKLTGLPSVPSFDIFLSADKGTLKKCVTVFFLIPLCDRATHSRGCPPSPRNTRASSASLHCDARWRPWRRSLSPPCGARSRAAAVSPRARPLPSDPTRGASCPPRARPTSPPTRTWSHTATCVRADNVMRAHRSRHEPSP